MKHCGLRKIMVISNIISLLVGIMCDAAYYLTLVSLFCVQYSHIVLHLFTKTVKQHSWS